MYDYSILQNTYNIDTTDGRVYRTPLGDFPSITTLLGKTNNQVWLQVWRERVGREEADRISKLATDRGTLVHTYMERFWNQEDIFKELVVEPDDVKKMVLGLIQTTQENVKEVWAQEIPVWSATLRVAGRLDKIGIWKNYPAIIDYKTSKKKKTATNIKDYYLQTAFYTVAHNELFHSNISRFVILIAVENEPLPQIFEGSVIPYVPDLKYRVNQFYKLFPNYGQTVSN